MNFFPFIIFSGCKRNQIKSLNLMPLFLLKEKKKKPHVIFLPLYHPVSSRRCLLLRKFHIGTTFLLLLSLSIYFLYPYDPTIQLTRVGLNCIKVNSFEDSLSTSYSLSPSRSTTVTSSCSTTIPLTCWWSTKGES